MLRKAIAAAGLAALLALPGGTHAAEAEGEVIDFDFSFEGPFGTFDQLQLQRGFQIYNTVCNGCHGLQYLRFHQLSDPTGPGLPEPQVRAIAAAYQCADPELTPGETRPCLPSDLFPANTAVGAPDLTLMAKGRAGFHGPAGLGINQLIYGIGGPEYVASLLVSYTGEEQEVAGAVLYENTVFPGGLIGMAPPLLGNDVEYTYFTATGAPVEDAGMPVVEPTVEQEAMDVAAFLMWAAEPHMVDRKQAGFRNLLMVILLAALLWYTNKKLWYSVKHRSEHQKQEGA